MCRSWQSVTWLFSKESPHTGGGAVAFLLLLTPLSHHSPYSLSLALSLFVGPKRVLSLFRMCSNFPITLSSDSVSAQVNRWVLMCNFLEKLYKANEDTVVIYFLCGKKLFFMGILYCNSFSKKSMLYVLDYVYIIRLLLLY